MAKSSLSKFSVVESGNAAFGQAGAQFINNTVAQTPLNGNYVALTVISDAIFTTLTPLDLVNGYGTDAAYNGDTLATVTIPEGTTLYGRWTNIQLASGQVLAYLG